MTSKKATLKGQTMEKCSVRGCENTASVRVVLYDVYPLDGSVFFEEDHTCPRLCEQHLLENEEKASGTREPRGAVRYPYSNKHGAQGFTIYQPL